MIRRVWIWAFGDTSRPQDEMRARARRIMAEAYEAFEDAELRREEVETAPPAARRQAQREPARREGRVYGSVAKFAEQRLRADPQARVNMLAVLAAYEDWCKEVPIRAAEVGRFADDLEIICKDRGATIGPAEGGIYCHGLRFAF